MSLQAEIAVAGGGPAGAIAALHLAQLGHHVILLASPRKPRHHGHETLTAGIAELLASWALHTHWTE